SSEGKVISRRCAAREAVFGSVSPRPRSVSATWCGKPKEVSISFRASTRSIPKHARSRPRACCGRRSARRSARFSTCSTVTRSRICSWRIGSSRRCSGRGRGSRGGRVVRGTAKPRRDAPRGASHRGDRGDRDVVEKARDQYGRRACGRRARLDGAIARRLVSRDAGQVPRAELELAGRARRRPANVSLVQPGRDRARDRDADRSLRVRQGSAAAYVQERGVAARLAGLGCAARGDRVSGAVAPAAPRRACRDHPRRRDAAAVEAARRLRRGRSAEARRAGRPRLARDGRALARVERDARGEEMSAMRVFLSYGFRPFFLLCGAWAIVPLAVLVAALVGMPWNAEALPLFRWHGHEMIFGFVAAAIAGFLLTASATWTGTPPIAGGRLAALALLWLAGRLIVSPVTGLHSTAAVLV